MGTEMGRWEGFGFGHNQMQEVVGNPGSSSGFLNFVPCPVLTTLSTLSPSSNNHPKKEASS